MPRPAPSKVTPWIESLILSYGGHDEEEEEEEERSGRLKAHVIGVGQMSLSQARSSDGSTGLLFLSDGLLQMPAVLTAAAWEHLQEQEERECYSSLLNTTVIIQNHRLRFHMNPERTKCRFFLSVGGLATTAAGPVKDNTPCCTSLPSVREKIRRTWRALLGQEESQRSQGGLDLSALLGEWQNDCLQAVLDDVRETLVAAGRRARSPSTGFDADRVRFKGEACFTVPVRWLLVGEAGGSSGTQQPGDAGDADAGDADAGDADAEDVSMATSPVLLDAGLMDAPLSNPWDLFPPLCISPSSSEASPEASPPRLRPDSVATVTSSKDSSAFPPYQEQASPLPGTSPTRRHRHAEQDLKDRPEQGAYRKPKRKRCEATPPGRSAAREQEEPSGSPPSWLFDSQTGSSGTEDDPGRTVQAKTPSMHGDGGPFRYSYQVSGQNLQDFSRFWVRPSLLHWAVKYLVAPKETDVRPDAS